MAIEIVPYNVLWLVQFAAIKDNPIYDLIHARDENNEFVRAQYVAIEHVGSTSIPGLHAKPIIGILIVVAEVDHVPKVKQALMMGDQQGGYRYIGDGGVKGRWSFKLGREDDYVAPRRNLYVVLEGILLLKAHIDLRETLRRNDQLRDEYGKVKMELAKKEYKQCYEYPEAKNGVIRKILKEAGWTG